MNFHGAVLKRIRAALLVMVLFLFLIEVSLPKVVWCHHSQGTAHLEFRPLESDCPCERCEEGPEQPELGFLDQTSGQSAWKAKNCWHETVFSDVGRPSLQSPPQKIMVLSHLTGLSLLAVFPEKNFIFAALLTPAPRYLFSCGLSPGEVFRC